MKQYHFFSIFIALIIQLNVFSQTSNSSDFYYHSGKLIADTSYSINKIQFSKWFEIENKFKEIFSKQINFPTYLRGTSTYGFVIASFIIDTNGILLNSKIQQSKIINDSNYNFDVTTVCDSIIKKNLERTIVSLNKTYKTNNAFIPLKEYFIPLRFHLNLNYQNSKSFEYNNNWFFYSVYSYH